jgi:polar amino acid transport system substrate-binding protein
MNTKRFLTQHCGSLGITSKSTLAFGALLMLIALAACASSSKPTATPTASADKLAEIMARGTLIVATDPNYAPQSELKEDAARATNTRCASNQHTASQLEGFDVDVAVEIARRLGVEACFVTPAWTLIVGGSWADRWDINVGSMTITPERMEVLYFTQPYYTTPAAFFVHKDNTTFAQPSDLSGKRVGVCTGCTYEFFLDGSLAIPGEIIDFVVKDAVIHGYEIDISAMQDLALGDGVQLDAVLVAQPTGQNAVNEGLPLKQLGEPVFFEYLAVDIDKKHSKDPVSLVSKLDAIIQQMHSDGTLLRLSQQYYGEDFTTAASQFDIYALGQLP